jgi:elongation factor G
MKGYDTKHLRALAVVGAPGSGKTTFLESALFKTGALDKKGSVESKNTVSDYLQSEQEHLSSLSTSIIPVEYNGFKINFLDTPGNRELISEVDQALAVVKGALVFVDGSKGIDVGSEQVLTDLGAASFPTIVFINKMDKENIKYQDLLNKLKDILGNKVVPFLYPVMKGEKFDGYVDLVDMKTRVLENGKIVEKDLTPDLEDEVAELREGIIEGVAESSEELLEKYFGGEELTNEEIVGGLRSGVLQGNLIPVIVGSAIKDIGTVDLLEIIEKYMPAPNDLKPIKGRKMGSDDTVERPTTDDAPLAAYCFKTTVDPFIGTINYIKVFSGTLESGQKIVVSNTEDTVKINQLTLLRGKEQIETDKLHAGDIGVVTKIDELFTGCTLADPKDPVVLQGPDIPGATIYVAIHPRNKRDEDKISTALNKIAIEDPSFEFKRNRETAQLLIGGQGMSHINIVLEKLRDIYKVEVDQSEPKIVYRETIKKTAEAEGRHKKQSGGSGQFGVVKMRFEPMNPNEKDFEFAEEIHGGTVPRNFWPAVEKGLIEHFTEGPLAGFPVIGVRAVLYDGQYHPVDSNEISFKLAAALAFKNALKDLAPTILEPIMKLKITVRDEYVGDVMGDINKRRGQVQGMNPLTGGKQMVIAEVPESEIKSYTIDLKAMTQGTGTFQREFVRYEEVPHHMIDSIIAEYTKDE